MTIRTERVGELIRQEVAAMLTRGEIKDWRLTGLLSVAAVEVTRDLQHATIFVSIMESDPAKQEAAIAGLNHAAGFVRSQLGRRIQLRLTPTVRFVLDPSIEQGVRMDRLLASLHIPPAEDEPEPSGPLAMDPSPEASLPDDQDQ